MLCLTHKTIPWWHHISTWCQLVQKTLNTFTIKLSIIPAQSLWAKIQTSSAQYHLAFLYFCHWPSPTAMPPQPFPSRSVKAEIQNSPHLRPPLPQLHYVAFTWGQNSRLVPAKQQGQIKGSIGGLCLETDTSPSFRFSKPTAHCIKDLSMIQCFCFLFFVIAFGYFYPSQSGVINMAREIFVMVCNKQSCWYGWRSEKIEKTKTVLGIGILIPTSLGYNSNRPICFCLKYNSAQFFTY